MTPEPNPPKTLIVDLSNLYGGSSSRVLSLLTRFPAGTAALAGLERGAVTREALRLGLPVHVLGSRKTDPRILSRLVRLIRSEGYQALDSQNIQSKVFASLAASLTRAALVSTINSWYANEHGKASLKGKIYTAVELATNWNLSLYIAVSERDRQNLLRARIPEDDIALIYNAVDAAQPPPADRGFLRREFNLPTDSTVCLAVGRLVRVKGYDVLVEAIKQAASHMSNIVCVIVGEGEAHEELTRQIHEAGLDGRVILAGYLPRETIASALASCDVFAMPSRYEGTPIAVLEAAAMACPILASDAGGIPELVANEEHALLVQPEDPSALAQGLIRLGADRAFARRLGENAQRRVREKFSLEAQVAATMDVYRKAWAKFNRER
ncbi:MAG: glycosyl transferase [Anaerolineaceae bacterium]|nr:glycosyltransferase family 1 protein [Chloroflexota bacterium]WKZ55901.1 MAG: glycosyltransferase family 4 protein [Anaerolineales bacterium]GJQ38163.1 MAG: glycosyl transferase [Anaerolineaceae bacterium]NOG76707.1 glycosyltransferase family 4 protein [Chloroflexota bacterium]GIK10696.1 MAG: glycosyl transferase [Chloroflexota bacterium]